MATVKLINAALDESPLRGGTIILRGVLDPGSLCALLADDYQREVLLGRKQDLLIEAMRAGEVIPDVELGMRGQSFYQPKKDGKLVDGEFILRDPVYIIDGLQRVSAAINSRSEMSIRLGAIVHFDTTREWERDRFYVLNTARLRVSSSVHLRNMREQYHAILALYGLSHADSFVLKDRIGWSQAMRRNDLITALTFAKIAATIHAWISPGLSENNVVRTAEGLERLVKEIGVMTFKKNVATYFDLLDKCWNIHSVQYREAAPQLKFTFMRVLATVLRDHKDFWGGKNSYELFVNVDIRRKLKLFRLTDPTVHNLCSSGGSAHHVLYTMMRDHINSGRRTGRLTPRDPDAGPVFVEDEEQEAA